MAHEIYDQRYLDFYDPDKCIGDLGEKWCNFKWRIYNLQLNPRETFQSPVFSTRLLPNSHWYLEVKLLSPGNLKTMEISLRRLQKGDDTISAVDVIYTVISDEEKSISERKTFFYHNETSQNGKYCYAAPFLKSKDSYITLLCNLRPNKVMIQDVRHSNLDETLPVHLRKLLLSSEVYDTIVQVGDRQFLAHYAILSARLPKLLPRGYPTEKGKHIIKVNDFPAFVVKEMLKYAYTGQAYIDLDSVLEYKDILKEYNNFFEKCCWEDNPFASSFFTYETDSLLWSLNGYCIHSNLGHRNINLLRMKPSRIEFSLDVLESQAEKKVLTLGFKFCCEEMPKPTILSCTYCLSHEISKEKIKLGESEVLLHSNVTKGRIKLYSLLEVKNGQSTLCVREDQLVLRTDFKFCYGSSKSSVEKLYEGQFDISQCTNCVLLKDDMRRLHRFVGFEDITLEGNDGSKIQAHKAILIARWEEAEKLKVKENRYISVDYNRGGLYKLLSQLYTGIASE